MRAVDTNVLVRLVVRDSPEQVRLAESVIASGAGSELSLFERPRAPEGGSLFHF
jgi:hypothetical protein